MNVFSGSEPLPNGCDISLADVSTNESEVKRRSLILSSSSTSGASGQTQVMNMLKKPFGAANLMTNKLKSSSSKHDIIDQNHHESTTNRYGLIITAPAHPCAPSALGAVRCRTFKISQNGDL